MQELTGRSGHQQGFAIEDADRVAHARQRGPGRRHFCELLAAASVTEADGQMMQECQKAGVELDKDTIQALAAQVPKE